MASRGRSLFRLTRGSRPVGANKIVSWWSLRRAVIKSDGPRATGGFVIMSESHYSQWRGGRYGANLRRWEGNKRRFCGISQSRLLINHN